MEVNTQQITQAIQTFLESVDATNLKAVKISFEEKSSNKVVSMAANCWEWDPEKQELVWVCG